MIASQIKNSLFGGKIIILYGPRQVGKTTLIQEIVRPYGEKVIMMSGDKLYHHTDLAFADGARIERIVQWKDILFIDEAQRISNIGLHLKVLYDSWWSGQIIATWSSSFDLANTISESLTWRVVVYTLFPLSLWEVITKHGFIVAKERLKEFMITWMYPWIIDQHGDTQRDLLDTLTQSYLYKDILSFDRLQKSQKLIDLLQLLALQIGSEVSYYELWQKLWLHTQSVEKYIDLLEKTFVIFRLPSYSSNPRNEIIKWKKIYFYDLWIRNSLLSAYTSLDIRSDIWALRENYCIIERLKWITYNHYFTQRWFWRSRNQREIDYIEWQNHMIEWYEIKWSIKWKWSCPKQFSDTYPHATYKVITPDTLWDRIGE